MTDSASLHSNDGEIEHRRALHRRLSWDTELPAALLAQLWDNPQSLLRGGEVLQEKPRCKVVRLNHRDGQFVLKHHSWGGWAKTIKKSWRTSSAQKSFYDTRFLRQAGVRTPKTWAFGQERIGPFSSSSFLLTEYVEGTSLYRYMRFTQPSEEIVERLADQVAKLWQQLADLSVSHNDFKTENFLVDPDGELWLIDLERMQRYRRLSKLRRKQLLDAAIFLHPRSWRAQPAAAEIFRQKLLSTRATVAALGEFKGTTHALQREVSSTNQPSQLVSVMIPCSDDDENDLLRQCIESVRDIADEIILAYSGTNARSRRALENHTDCTLLDQLDMDELALEDWARTQARHPWILRLLPSERLNAELGKQVQDRIAAEPDEDGFRIQRRFYFQGKPLRFGCFRNDFPIRLYRRNVGKLDIRSGRIEVAVPTQKTGSLLGKLLCNVEADLEQQIHDLNRLTSLSAITAGAAPFSKAPLDSVAVILNFFHSYIFQLGWRDGPAGLNASWQQALAIWLYRAKCREFREDQLISSAFEQRAPIRVFVPQHEATPGGAAISSGDHNVADKQQTRVAA